jgi:predicted phage terminase large subunit-like protein
MSAHIESWSDVQRSVAVQLARNNFYFYTRWMFRERRGYKWLRGPHHRIICDALMRVFTGECHRLIINVAPRYSKTELAVVNFISWTLGHFPDSEWIHTSYSSALATNNTWNAREMVQSESYQEIFPEVVIRSDKAAQHDWRTTAGGVVYAAGTGGTITGFGGGKMREGFGGGIVLDDPHKPDEVRSDIVRNGDIEWFQNTLESRKNSPHTPIILIMQRLHEEDLSGWLLGRDYERRKADGLPRVPGGNGEIWDHVCLDTIKEDGTALWPQKHDIATLRRMEQASPYVFAGQYRQRPSAPAGNIFKPDNMPIVDAIPVGTRFVRAWDFAASVPKPGQTDPDWTVGLKLGKYPNGRYIIAGMVRIRETPENVERALVNTAGTDGKECIQHLPQDPGAAGKANVASQTRLLSGFPVASDPVSGDKVLRAQPFAAQVNVGNVDMLRAPWNDEVKDEMRVFPNGAHDDIEDAGADAFNHLNGGNLGMLDFMKQLNDQMKVEDAAKAEAAKNETTGAGQAMMNALLGLNVPKQ